MTDTCPIFYEVHADFAKAGLVIPKIIKFGGKSEPIILEINPQVRRVAYYNREGILILAAELGSAYHADPLPGVGNGFTIKFRGLEQNHPTALHEVDHILANCHIDARRERDILVALCRTTQSRDGTLAFLLDKYFQYPHKFVRSAQQCKDDDKKPAKIVTTTINTLIFNPPTSSTPRRALLHETWEVTSDPKKFSVGCIWHPPSSDPLYKKQLSDWNNKKSKLTIYAESAKQASDISEGASGGRRFLQHLPPAPRNIDALRDEMYEAQRKQLQSNTPTTPTTAAIQTEALAPTPTSSRRQTLQEQAFEAQQASQRQRASALHSTTLDFTPAPSPSSSTTLVSPVPQKSLGKRSTLLAQAKASVVHSPSHLSALPEDIAPPPPPMDDDDPPPPPPLAVQPKRRSFVPPVTTSFVPPPPVPDLDDDDPPPPPPPGFGFGSGTDDAGPEDDDDDDEEPPPPGGISAPKFKSASSHVIIDDIPLQMPPTVTPRASQPSPMTFDQDMPLQPLSKPQTSSRGSLQPENNFSAIAPQSHSDFHVEVVEEGDFVKEIRTEIITDPHTGSRQQRVTETITPRVVTDRSRSLSSVPGAAEPPLPQIPCPPGCHYRYVGNNPLTRKCQLVMDDAVLGVLDPKFELPFTSANGEPVFGILPDPSCDLPDNYLMTTSGLIVECRVNGIVTINDSLIAQASTETPIHLLGRPIARQGQTLMFLAQGCIPGSDAEMEVFLPPEDEEMPPPPPQIEPDTPSSKPLPPTPVSLSIDLSITGSHEHPLGTPVYTPSAAGPTFTFGAAGVELKIFLEGRETEPIGVIEVPADVDSSTYFFSHLRDQIIDELDDIPDDFCFLVKGARLTSKQEPKRSVATLSEASVVIRDVKKYELQKAEEEERQKRLAARPAPAPAPPGSAPPPPSAAPRGPPPGAPRGIPPGPPSGAPRGIPPGAPRGIPPGSQPPGAGLQPPPGSQPPPGAGRPAISMAALQGGASALKKTQIPQDKVKPPSLLDQLKGASGGGVQLKKVDHEKIRAEKEKRKHRQSVAGGSMFGSIKVAMAQRREVTVEEDADDTDSDWD